MRPRFFPLVLIGVGTAALLANLGVLPAEALRETAFTFWPLILIAVGLMALFGRHHCGAHREARCRAQPDTASSVTSPDTLSR